MGITLEGQINEIFQSLQSAVRNHLFRADVPSQNLRNLKIDQMRNMQCLS